MIRAENPDSNGVVLNVDDHEPARYAKGRVLQGGGYEVIDAADGNEAIEFAIARRPDLVLLDVRLPGVDGFEVCRRLRADPRTQSIAIVHTSASFTGTEDRIRGLDGGADAYLTAPAEPRILLATVGSLMRARRAEKALRASEERFRTLADSAPVLIWRSDRTKNIRWFNRRWLEFTGRTVEPGRDEAWTENIHPDDRERSAAAFDRAFDQCREFEIELRRKRADGEYRWMVDRGTPLTNDAGEFTGFIGSCIDIEDRHALEEQRRRLLQVERSARIEGERVNRVKDEFLATLSHELRTPLNAILGWTHVLRSNRVDESVRKDGLDAIERNAKIQTRLIDDLLDVSRINSGKLSLELRPISLIPVIHAAIESAAPPAKAKSIEIVSRLDPASDRRILGDAERLQQVIGNLLSNAVKFTPERGRIEIDLVRADAHVEIAIKDDGLGIKPEFLPFVFEPFQQADSTTTRRHGGLGLGLSIVRTIVELHGGRVSAHSAGDGQGSTFTVHLPLPCGGPRPDPLADDRAGSPPGSEISLQGRTILVVDDEPDAREMIRRLLIGSGATVVTADSVANAVLRLEQGSFDLVISDIGMPSEDGYSFIRHVRSPGGLALRTPAIALTALARPEDRVRSLDAGFQSYFAKPFDPDALLLEAARLTARAP